jgi:DNA-directed RNA polymerase subunit RPC12/RpoP
MAPARVVLVSRMSSVAPKCAHCQSKHLRKYRSLEETARSFLTWDLGVRAMVRRTRQGEPSAILPLLCESCQRHSFECPKCRRVWPVMELPKVFTRLACPDCGHRIQYMALFEL